jgi:hypothetical protein
MEQNPIMDKLDTMTAKQVRAYFSRLTRDELEAASKDPFLWKYTVTITAEAAHRYFHGKD